MVGDAALYENATLSGCVKSYERDGYIVAQTCSSIKTIYLNCEVDDSLLLAVIREVKSAAWEVLNRSIGCYVTKRSLENEVRRFGGSIID